MEVAVEVGTQRDLPDVDTPSKDTKCISAECLRMAASWPGLALTVLGSGSLTYGLYASSTAFCIAAGVLGGPGIALLVGACTSYCFDQAENDEEIALVSRNNASASIATNGGNPTAVPSTTESSVHKQAVQDWLAIQLEVEERLKRKSLQVPLENSQESITHHTAKKTTNPTDGTAVSIADMRNSRRQTASNPKSHRNLRVRSGEQDVERKLATRVRTTSQVVRNSLMLEDSATSGEEIVATDQEDGKLSLEQEYEMLKAQYDSLHSSASSSDSSEHD